MDSLGIQGIINRINEIEAKFQSLDPAPPAESFQSILQQNMQPLAQPVSLNPAQAGLITYHGFPMTQKTADAFGRLESLINARFPGKQIIITSTTGGVHQDPNHYAGKAIDFVLEGITLSDSKALEDLCRKAGFTPFNEYVHDSRFKTGPHMHIDLAG